MSFFAGLFLLWVYLGGIGQRRRMGDSFWDAIAWPVVLGRIIASHLPRA